MLHPEEGKEGSRESPIYVTKFPKALSYKLNTCKVLSCKYTAYKYFKQIQIAKTSSEKPEIPILIWLMLLATLKFPYYLKC